MFYKFSYMLLVLYFLVYYIVEFYDYLISYWYLCIIYFLMKYFDKMFMGMIISFKNVEDVMDMCVILFGDDFIDSYLVMIGNCNGNSLLVWDEIMLGVMCVFCK